MNTDAQTSKAPGRKPAKAKSGDDQPKTADRTADRNAGQTAGTTDAFGSATPAELSVWPD